MERKVALKALVGSHNYNLSVDEVMIDGIEFPASDKDYKVFVLPTFEDLYKGQRYANQIIGETEDLDIHDIRKLSDLLYKANINYLEVLFSNEIIISEELNSTQRIFIKKLLNNRDDIARMNLPHLFNACGGMYLKKMSLLRKGTEGTQHLVEAFGYDTKQALHAYRVINFIERFAKTDFKDFKGAITYSVEEREFMLEIKHGFFTVESFENFITFYHDSRFKQFKDAYHSFEPNVELKERIDEWIMKLVKYGIRSEY